MVDVGIGEAAGAGVSARITGVLVGLGTAVAVLDGVVGLGTGDAVVIGFTVASEAVGTGSSATGTLDSITAVGVAVTITVA